VLKSIGKVKFLLELLYLWHNPYRVSKRFLQKRGSEDVHQYGETPLETVIKVCKAANVTKEDHLFELGCGRGLTAFFIRDFFGCKVTGIEQIPLFIKKACQINKLFSLGIEFRCEDFCESDLSDATVIYLYGTCLPDDIIEKICKKIKPNQRVISISYPLSDYDPEFRILKTIEVDYPWGQTEAFINEK
jgi:hypothetical protein